MDKYVRPKSEDICSAIERHGLGALLTIPEKFEFRRFRAEREPFREIETKTVCAVDLAIGRIRELEEKLAGVYAWQERFLGDMLNHQPTSRSAENWMGWRLLCLDAREAYAVALADIAGAVRARRETDDA